jgi:hypothetical protein
MLFHITLFFAIMLLRFCQVFFKNDKKIHMIRSYNASA